MRTALSTLFSFIFLVGSIPAALAETHSSSSVPSVEPVTGIRRGTDIQWKEDAAYFPAVTDEEQKRYVEVMRHKDFEWRAQNTALEGTAEYTVRHREFLREMMLEHREFLRRRSALLEEKNLSIVDIRMRNGIENTTTDVPKYNLVKKSPRLLRQEVYAREAAKNR